MASSSVPAAQLVYNSYGPPLEVVKYTEAELQAPEASEISVEILGAPINPSDINTIEGKYPIKPPLPATPGLEGVGRVKEVGSQVQGLSPGDWVIPREAGEGTWRQAGVFTAHKWHRVPNDISLEAAATLIVNPPTALRMLEEFEELKAGDVVVQNGANSAVGQYVIQIAKAKGLHTVNVVRDRPDLAKLVSVLKDLGATLVTTEERLKADLAASGLARPRLALNCVGGSSATAIAKTLGAGATLVTYGGMSMQPVTIPTSLFIFKDIKCRGFWLSNMAAEGGVEKRLETIDRIVRLYQQGLLKTTSCERLPLTDYRKAFERYYAGFQGAKLIFTPNTHLIT